MPTTANGLVYPVLGDDNNPPADLQALAQSVDQVYGRAATDWSALLGVADPFAGQEIWVHDHQGKAVYTGTKWLAPEIYIEKAADETRTSTSTLTDDADFVYAIPQAGTYLFELDLMLLCASGQTGDAKFAFAFPTGTCDFTGQGASIDLGSGTAIGDGFWRQIRGATSGSSTISFGTTSSFTLGVRIFGKVNASTAGDLKLMWAQDVSNANTTTMFERSTMRVKNVA